MAESQIGVAAGRAARSRVPLGVHGRWEPGDERPDPIGLLEEQGKTRVRDLLPIRYGRMLASPLAFYRGAAAIMAADLAGTPCSGLRVQLCGDAHLGNFGGFASAERALVFDINDFDETIPGPWEWDLKRLAASLEIAGRQNGIPSVKRQRIATAAADAYRSAMQEFADSPFLELWSRQLDVQAISARWAGSLDRKGRKRLASAHLRAKDHQRAVERLTRVVDGEVRFVSTPPLVERFEDMMATDEAGMFVKEIQGYLEAYKKTLSDDRRRIFDHFAFRDLARRVVGIGSVGTRTNIVLLDGRDKPDHLVLQVKEALRSVLEPYAGRSAYLHSGRRVVEGQRLMQASSDILLGWVRGPGLDGVVRDYYVRQLWDKKVSLEIGGAGPKALRAMGEACAWSLARAHARSGDRLAISTYLGKGMAFANAIARFAVSYADQNQRDYEALVEASERGRIVARHGV